jgi:hypothetical protein
MKRSLLPATVLMLACACHSSQPETRITPAVNNDTVKKNYLPVSDYLLAEIANVDSFPLRIMRYHIVNGKKDSTIITTADFDRIAREFLLADLDSSRFEKKFEENSFIDRSTELVSFTYSTKDTANGLKRVDILLSPGTSTNRLNSIYMESINVDRDSSVISKMFWKAGRNLSILHIRNLKNEPETTEQTIVVWDPRD